MESSKSLQDVTREGKSRKSFEGNLGAHSKKSPYIILSITIILIWILDSATSLTELHPQQSEPTSRWTYQTEEHQQACSNDSAIIPNGTQ